MIEPLKNDPCDKQVRLRNLCVWTALVFCLSSCRTANNLTISLECDPGIEQILALWKDDSMGCAKYRNQTNTRLLVDCYHLEDVPLEQLRHVLGHPDLQTESTQEYRIKYYFNSLCSNGDLIDSADYCWIEFRVPKQHGVSTVINYICL
jgi:hypothetical protein